MTDPTERASEPSPDTTSEPSPGPIATADLVGTCALVASVAASAASDAGAVDAVGLVVSAVLFVGGCVGFAIGFLRAAGRSRFEVIDLAGLFYLTGAAPRPVRRRFLGLWAVQIVAALLAVFVASPPFQVMAPVWGIGLITWWASGHGTFPARPGVARR